MAAYDALSSPRSEMSDDRFQTLVNQMSQDLGELDQALRSLEKKMGSSGAVRDLHRARRVKAQLSQTLDELALGVKTGSGVKTRSRNAQHRKLSHDFQSMMDRFKRLSVQTEQMDTRKAPSDEDALFTQAKVTTYHEADGECDVL